MGRLLRRARHVHDNKPGDPPSLADDRTPLMPAFGQTGLLPDQRNLEIGGAVLLRIKAAAVNIARPPEQQVAFKVDEVVLHEVRPFFQSDAAEVLRSRKVAAGYSLSHPDNVIDEQLPPRALRPAALGAPHPRKHTRRRSRRGR
jgi:hypothetical protein